MSAREILELFILRTKRYYKVNRDFYFLYSSDIPIDMLGAWYEEARFVYQYDGDFETFSYCIINHRVGTPRKRTYSNYNKAPSYAKKPHHRKKTKEEKEKINNKKRWKKSKDKRITKGWWNRSPGKFYKNFSNRKHRMWQKQKIHNADWEELHDGSYKHFRDSWLWD